MNVQVKHNSVDITNYVIAYDREHKICTGVGQLTLEVAQTIGRTFNPWDTIDIYENGSFQVKYYVSSVSHDIPKATYTIDCQDNSKRLVDYFIPDSYVIDYPTYTKYWIEKFLTEAGISYTFLTASYGSLLSNYTQLGLNSAYEQIKVLLQQSGWFMFFDGNGIAKIGTLDTDLSNIDETLNRGDILEITTKSHDKMLRNRALVLGAYDPLYDGRAMADLTVHTPWNYDHNDIRTVVISNSNIPNSSTAFGMATQIIKEFGRITVEKHITATGARSLDLGDYVHVNTTVYRGNGLVTTFGTSLSSAGLVTNLILDERCPRLFGYFDFGDSVYVATYGDGVWRKHIKFDTEFSDFSTGLESDMAITDLHINNGLFSCVAASGNMSYTINDLPWKSIVVESLESSMESNLDDAASSRVYIPILFSGISARATIIDRVNNRLLYGADTSLEPNLGDYWLSYSGYSFTQSGIVNAENITYSGYRGWIIEYTMAGGFSTPSDSYPIHVSGNYDIRVVDIENDGVYDYVSVAEYGESDNIPYTSYGYNLGSRTSIPSNLTHDSNNKVAVGNFTTFEGAGDSYNGTTAGPFVSVFDNESIQEREVVWRNSTGGVMKRTKLSRDWNPISEEWELSASTDTSPAVTFPSSSQAIVKMSTNVYRLYSVEQTNDANNYYTEISYIDWDVDAGTMAADVSCGTLTVPKDLTKVSFTTYDYDSIHIGGKLWWYVRYRGDVRTASASYNNYIKFYALVVNTSSGSAEINGLVHTQNYQSYIPGFGQYHWRIGYTGGNTLGWLFQNGSTPALNNFIIEYDNDFKDDANSYMLYSQDGITFNQTLLQSTLNYPSDVNFLATSSGETEGYKGAKQLTKDYYIVYLVDGTKSISIVTNGSTVSIGGDSVAPFQWQPGNITPIFSPSTTNYIAKNGSTYYWCTPGTLTAENAFSFPANYTITYPFSDAGYYGATTFWLAYDTDLTKNVLLRASTSAFISSIETNVPPAFTGTEGWIGGNFFMDGLGENYLCLLNTTGIPLESGIRFLVLRRDEDDFNIIQAESYPIRMDVSNYSPLLTVTSGSDSFTSNFIYEESLTQVNPFNILGEYSVPIDDYRYALLDTFSGYTLVAVTPSGFYTADVITLSGVDNTYSIASGVPSRIETTNYAGQGQYMFVTTSGNNPVFYQRDADSVVFDEYDSLPESRATIIRIDDRM